MLLNFVSVDDCVARARDCQQFHHVLLACAGSCEIAAASTSRFAGAYEFPPINVDECMYSFNCFGLQNHEILGKNGQGTGKMPKNL